MASDTRKPELVTRCARGVLHVINGEHYAGAERVQDLLAERLPELGYAVTFACLKPGKFPQARMATEAELECLTMRSRLDLSVVGRVEELARRSKVSILHTHTPRTAIIGRIVAERLGLPLVHHVHSPASRDSERWFMNQTNALVEKWSMRRCNRLVAVSESLKNDVVAAGVPADRVCVVYNGVPCGPRRAERVARDIPWTLGVVGLFRPRKGMEVFLDALSRLRRDDVRVRAIGPFETQAYEAHIKREAVRLGVSDLIEWHGFTPDVGRQFTEIDVLVLPSLYGEGTPLVVLEAMAAGVPVVGTRVGGVSELIRHGVDGLLVPPAAPEALGEAIERIMSGALSWHDMSAAAHQRQQAEFSDRAMARAVAGVYEATLR